MATWVPGGWPWTSTASTTAPYLYTWPWYSSTSTATTSWTQPATNLTAVWNQWVIYHEPVMRSAEEQQRLIDERQRQREEQSRRLLAQQARLEGAQERALELLEMILTPEERVYRDEHQGEMLVRGASGRMYVIDRRGVHGNVREVDEHGCVLARVCVAPTMYDHEARAPLPLADGWIGQILAIRHNEEEFRARGNWSYRRECTMPNVPILRAA